MRFKDFVDCAESNDFVTCEKCFTMSDFCFNEDFLASDAFCAIDEQRLLMDLFENPRTNKQTSLLAMFLLEKIREMWFPNSIDSKKESHDPVTQTRWRPRQKIHDRPVFG